MGHINERTGSLLVQVLNDAVDVAVAVLQSTEMRDSENEAFCCKC